MVDWSANDEPVGRCWAGASALLILLLSSCSGGEFPDGLRFACDEDNACTSGYACSPQGICVREGGTDEECNGLDDDLDGATDEELVAPSCERSEGVCAGAARSGAACRGAAGWAACGGDEYGEAYEPEEGRCDGLDNDCDGLTDELRETSATDCGTCGFSCPAPTDECEASVCHVSAASLCGYLVGPNDVAEEAEMCLVPAGTYVFGADAETGMLPSALLFDRFEVTNERYALFVGTLDSPTGALPRCVPEGPRAWAESDPHFPDALARHPVVCVTRAQAAAFCVWSGKRLPTEEEWEAAARAGDDRAYPWGDETPTGRANCLDVECHDIYPTDTCAPVEGAHERCEETAPMWGADSDVTLSGGASPLGPLHLAGNVAEWVSDDAEGQAVVRGGSWYDTADDVRAWSRRLVGADYARTTVGFRCVEEWPPPATE